MNEWASVLLLLLFVCFVSLLLFLFVLFLYCCFYDIYMKHRNFHTKLACSQRNTERETERQRQRPSAVENSWTVKHVQTIHYIVYRPPHCWRGGVAMRTSVRWRNWFFVCLFFVVVFVSDARVVTGVLAGLPLRITGDSLRVTFIPVFVSCTF